MMKAIKVNFRMLDGRPTSTTIGGTIAEFYAQALGVKSIDFVDNNGVINKKEYEKKLRQLVQDAVNKERENTEQCDIELNKDFIERMIFMRAKNLYIKKSIADKQLDLI